MKFTEEQETVLLIVSFMHSNHKTKQETLAEIDKVLGNKGAEVLRSLLKIDAIRHNWRGFWPTTTGQAGYITNS